MTSREVNFDGLVGPTHHYGGLGHGNLASQQHATEVSSPQSAALQGIAKMRYLLGRGLTQGILLPHERPHIPTLRAFGFEGSDGAVVEAAFKADPGLVSAVSSASAMWTANAATMSPSTDTADGRLHLTSANLTSHLHRSIEARTTHTVLRAYFGDERHFVVHPPVPPSDQSGDEGAANHSRLTAGDHSRPGVGLFVHGGSGGTTYRARQSVLASRAVARQHGLRQDRVLFATQGRQAIDAGVFHNDVIAVADRGMLLHHELAFSDTAAVMGGLRQALGEAFDPIQVPAAMLPLEDAVASYLFNSQLLELPNGTRLLLAPTEVHANPRAAETTEWLRTQGIDEIVTLDLRQSMSNGGGPACLRLRVVMNEEELKAMHPGPLMTSERLDRLGEWVRTHYRTELTLEDLGDPHLLDETRTALDGLTAMLGLGPLYDFQR